MIPYLVMPIVTSALAIVQASQMFPMEGKNCMPHIGQRIVTSLFGSISIVDKLNIIIPHVLKQQYNIYLLEWPRNLSPKQRKNLLPC